MERKPLLPPTKRAVKKTAPTTTASSAKRIAALEDTVKELQRTVTKMQQMVAALMLQSPQMQAALQQQLAQSLAHNDS
jgi:ABC-type transporter Mla subunit MlaD